MPTYISKDGVFYPAKEKVGLVNRSNKTITNPSAKWSEYHGKKIKPGEPFIYEGPDRASLFEFHKEKVETLGIDFKKDPEFINRIRQMGYTVEEYLQAVGYNEENVEKDFKKKATVVTKHELPMQVKSIETLGGGADTAGQGLDKYGGFGEPPD